VSREDLILLSRDLDGESPWLDAGEPVTRQHVLSASARTGRSPQQLVARLVHLGMIVTDQVWPASVDDDDLIMLSRDIDGDGPWLEPGNPITIHVLVAAARLGRSPIAVAERLRELGVIVAERRWPPAADRKDLTLLSQDLTGGPPWLTAEEINRGHVLAAAVRLGRSPDEVVARLVELDLPVPPGDWPSVVTRDDLTLLSVNGTGRSPWLSSEDPLPSASLITLAREAGCGIGEAARRLVELGFILPAGVTVTEQVS
jgi:hypothetical protein